MREPPSAASTKIIVTVPVISMPTRTSFQRFNGEFGCRTPTINESSSHPPRIAMINKIPLRLGYSVQLMCLCPHPKIRRIIVQTPSAIRRHIVTTAAASIIARPIIILSKGTVLFSTTTSKCKMQVEYSRIEVFTFAAGLRTSPVTRTLVRFTSVYSCSLLLPGSSATLCLVQFVATNCIFAA